MVFPRIAPDGAEVTVNAVGAAAVTTIGPVLIGVAGNAP